MADFDPQIHHRKSIRMRGYDYASKGAYYLTICTHRHSCLFGNVEFPKLLLNDVGLMIQKTWDEMPQFYEGVELDLRIVMPNHLQGIILLSNESAPDAKMWTLGELVSRFKTLSARRYRLRARSGEWREAPHPLWQRNYYEHILRDEAALDEIRAYIEDNPRRWAAKSIGL